MPAEWIHQLRKQPMEKDFPITGKALWEENEEDKPYFLKIAIPKVKEDWSNFFKVTTERISHEKDIQKLGMNMDTQMKCYSKMTKLLWLTKSLSL